MRFGFHPLRADLTAVLIPSRRAVPGRDVALGQVVHRQSHQRRRRRLIFHAHFQLFPFAGIERSDARRPVGLQVGLEGGAVADIGRQAKVKGVQQTGTPGKLAVVFLAATAVGKVGGTHFRPVIAAGKQQLPVFQAQLILQVEANLIEILLFIAGGTEGAFIDLHTIDRGTPVEIVL